jgi:hypothetical protein
VQDYRQFRIRLAVRKSGLTCRLWPKIYAWRGLREATLSYTGNGMLIRPEARLHDDFPTFRREDLRLVTGHGQYADDLNLAHAAHAVMVRSPHAHAVSKRVAA